MSRLGVCFGVHRRRFTVKRVAGPFEASLDIDEILRDSVMHAKERLKAPATAESDENRLIDKIIAAQVGLRP